MGLLERVAQERKSLTFGGGQGFSEPPFWALDHYRSGLLSYSQPDRERIENDFDGYIEGAYKSDGIVFACVLTRQLIFSEARFQWREFRNGRPGPLFGSPELALLENPWPNATTGELLSWMEVDLSLAGNFYGTTADDKGRLGKAATGPGRRISRLRPDWVTIVISSASGDPRAADARPVGYLYEPQGPGVGGFSSSAVVLMPDEVCHYSVVPDPSARFRGMSWLTPVLKEISSDRAATTHKYRFFDNGATLSTLVSFDKEVGVDAFEQFVDKFNEQHQGTDNAYKPLFVGAGADVTVVGADLRQIDFKSIQGAIETRIAAASGVGAVVAQFSEGMQGSSLNAGNYSAARRRVGDGLFRPLWRTASAALQTLVTPPSSTAQLWYVDDISFLREDAKDAADIFAVKMQAIRNGTDAGFEPDAVIDATETLDVTRLRGEHTGLFSVQLQKPVTDEPEPPEPEPSSNGDRPALPVGSS